MYVKKNAKGRKPVDKEKKQIYNKEYRINNKEKILKKVKAYQSENREKILRKKKEYRIANKEKISIEMKAWREKNKHKSTIYTNNRRARKKGNGGTYTLEEWNNLKEKYNHTCLCCGKKEPLVEITVDHVLPLSKGGDNNLENLQPLCRQCNMEKGTKEIDYR